MSAQAQLSVSTDRHGPVHVPHEVDRIEIILIQPSQYHDDGFPHRYYRVVVPSNSLAVMNSLTQDALAALQLTASSAVHMYEDRVQNHAVELAQLYRRFPEAGTKLIVGFVGVQTGQFPRAVDLIKRWQQVGATCVIGGPHVSGTLATMYYGINDPRRPGIPCPHQMPTEIQELMDNGVIVVNGEAEGLLPQLLTDIVEGHPKPLYNGGQPDITHAPMPKYPPGYLQQSFATPVITIDACRGCPYVCHFCVVINAQGRTARPRSPAEILAYVQEICERYGKATIFFVDDNFARNRLWGELLDGLAALRKKGYDIHFMMESDLKSYLLPGFLQKLEDAGCDQIFMGVESMNQANLLEAGKAQNDVTRYQEFWAECNRRGIMVHAGYMIGFDHDTPESVPRDIDELHRLGVDFASFFMRTLLPGSQDHVEAVVAGVPIDPDFTHLDSFHATSPHPRMTKDEWEETYRKAWEQFFAPQKMIIGLKRARDRRALLYLLKYCFWARWSFATEGTHPMIAGFFRYRAYGDRRPGAIPLSRGRFAVQEFFRRLRYVRRLLAELLILQYVMFEVDVAPLLAEKRLELSGRARGVGDWFRRTFGRAVSRGWLNAFWREYAGKRWRLLSPQTYHWHLLTVPHSITEVVYAVRYAVRIPRLIRILTAH